MNSNNLFIFAATWFLSKLQRMTKIRILLSILFISSALMAQNAPVQLDLNWDGLKNDVYGVDTLQFLHFEDALYDTDFGMLPTFVYTQKLSSYSNQTFSATLSDIKTAPLTSAEVAAIDTSNITADFKINSNLVTSRGESYLEINVLPLHKKDDGTVEKLVSAKLEITTKAAISLKSAKTTSTFAENSVLASGAWVKIAVTESGMYKLTYNDIVSLGLDPQKIRIFGNGGKMLDVKFTNRIYDDLEENAVWYSTGSDGTFNSGDFLLFYAQGPNTWELNTSTSRYVHTQHVFDNKAYYFLTSDAGYGKQISTQSPVDETPNYESTSFDDYRYLEPDNQNLVHSGSLWVSDKISLNDAVDFSFNFPNLVNTEVATAEYQVVARNTAASSSSTFRLSYDGTNLNYARVGTSSVSTTGEYAKIGTAYTNFQPTGDDVNLSLQFTSTDGSALGWYDYLRITARRELKMTDSQMAFRDKKTIGLGNITKFTVTDAADGLVVLDVTNWTEPMEMNTTISDGSLTFKQYTDELNEFIAFNPNGNFDKPEIIGSVANQNLHAIGQTDYLMIVHEDFMDQAERLAELHRETGLTVTVTNIDDIYNEFSSGQRDITALRWYAKSIYDKFSNGEKLRYLLLFGDGTFDNRKDVLNNPNFIPTYQSESSLNQSETYTSDDYFGFMDNSEGTAGSTDRVDLGVGRFPVQTVQQATQVVDKIEQYMQNKNRKPWKNKIAFMADDKDNNIHATDANTMADKIMTNYPEMEVEKIFIHAYQRVTTASGPSYPDANKLIDNAVEEGSLLLNYSGHGGEVGLADEKIVTMTGVQNYSNLNNLPLWVTATCEFSRYDLKDFTTAGEEVLLNERGGGIGLFTTTRLVYSSANFVINYRFFDYIFENDANGDPNRLGDAFRLTKKNINTGVNKRKFSLLGDPGLMLNYASEKVMTGEINGVAVTEGIDTLKALSDITVTGFIAKANGEIDSDFNGTLYPKVYDKIANKSTIVDEVNPTALDFKVWETVLFTGQTEVVDGEFSFTFKVPKDIDYFDGGGRIVYYATDDTRKTEANGYFEDLIVGGFDENPEIDNDGPDVDLYLNSPDFTNGDRVNPSPTLIADITDITGINTTGASIGHDIVVMLNDNPTTMQILNEYYVAGSDQTNGQLRFKFEELDEGDYTLFFRVWDIYNNPTVKTISFKVESDVKPEIQGLTVYPNPAGEDNESVFFKFVHDRPDEVVEIQIEIFDVNGRRMAILSPPPNTSTGNDIEPIEWDLTTGSGNRVSKGLYLFRVTMKDATQTSVGATQKLLIR